MKLLLAALTAALGSTAAASGDVSPTAGDAARGEQVYRERCAGCHSLDANRVGPAHRGVYGRRAGQAPGYGYSPALRRSEVVWDETSLDRWLADPQAFLPGQRMNFRLSDPAMRADVIAYLRSVSPASAEER